MELIADTHIHLYPAHDAGRLIAGAYDRLKAHASGADAIIMLCLTEGAGHAYFDRLREGAHGLPGSFRVDPTGDPAALRVHLPGGALLILAGQQIVTRERMEVLSLASTEPIPDGLPAAEVVPRVLAAGGVPVLAWAPGKWMFKRAEVVRQLLQLFGPEQLLLGDSSLRATGWPEPRAMRERKTLAGSDPLPFAGEEEQAGRYAVRLQADVDPEHPASSLGKALLDPSRPVQRIGARNAPWLLARRMIGHYQQKRAAR